MNLEASMSRWKRIILLGILAFVLNAQLVVLAANDDSQADYLNSLGILRGTGSGYALEKELNRVEAAVMIVRLRGDEQEAIDWAYDHPFTDVPSWADPYVGYLYHYGLTSGKSPTVYGAYDMVTAEQYVTFLLRVLGYDDAAGDFYWSDSLQKAAEIGLERSYPASSSAEFTRGEMVDWTYNVLSMQMKGSAQTLVVSLQKNAGSLKATATAQLILSYDTYVVNRKPSSYQALLMSVKKLAYDLEPYGSFDVSGMGSIDLNRLMDQVNEDMLELPMYSSIIRGYNLSRKGDTLTIHIDYNITPEQHDQAIGKAKDIIQSVITDGMTDYEKEKAIHDYIVDHVIYDEAGSPGSSSFTMYGALVKESAVCHGYAESFRYLGYLAGLDVKLVSGESLYNGQYIGHAWNIITLDGETYHVDTTWDDPIGDQGGIRSYAYFNVTDEVLEKDHIWLRNNYERCDATYYNYFVYESMEVDGHEGLRRYLQNGFDQGVEEMVVRVAGEQVTMSSLKGVLMACDRPYSITYKVNTVSNVVTVKRD